MDGSASTEQVHELQERLRILTEPLHLFAEAATDHERLLEVVARQLSEVVKDGCIVRLMSPDGWLKTVAAHLPFEGRGIAAEDTARLRAFLSMPHHIDSNPSARQVVVSGEALLVPHLRPEQIRAQVPAEIAALYEPIGIHSMLLVALRVRGETIGLLSIFRFVPGSRALDERDRQLAQTLADHAALAISNSRLYADAQRELTGRREAETALRSSEESLRLLVDGVRDYAMYLIDLGGIVTSWNAGAERMKGYTAHEIVGSSHERFYRRVDIDAGKPAALLDAARSRGRAEEEGLRVRKDGKEFLANVVVTSLIDPAGVPFAFASITRDLTEKRSLEEQVRQGQKLEAIGRLAGGVAHDFNNILSVVLSYSDMILGDLRPDEPMRDDVEQIRSAGSRATDLTRQLLAFGRRQVLEPKPVNLNEIVAAGLNMFRRLIGENIELTFFPAADLGAAILDANQVDQVIINLVVNARDAMPRTGKIAIETSNVTLDAEYAARHADVTAGHYVMLAVSDTGSGMDAETQKQIFEPFFTTKETGKGTGLGLSTVFGIVRQSGGHIWVYSELGQGTVFKIYFPRTDQPAAARQSRSLAGHRGGSEHILLVEDDERVRSVARSILQRNGYQVLEAQSGGDALLICEQHVGVIHLLLTDVVMPRMSGRQLADRLRSIRPDMKVLYMSGYTDDAIVDHGVLEAGVSFLQKPITPETLLRKVRLVIDGPRSRT